MPLTPAGISGLVATNLASTGMLGIEVPKLALGVGIGVSTWAALIQVQTVDTGSAGAGTGGPVPLVVPGTLIGNMQTGFAASGLIGILSPALSLGLANGLIQAFPQGMILTAHTGVGSGAGVAKFIAPPAAGSIIAGLASAGVIGQFQAQLGAAIGMGLDLTFASLVIPVPIIGTASPTAASGTGFGKIV